MDGKYLPFNFILDPNSGQNFGIVMAFFGGFVVALLVFSEFNTATSFDAFRVMFKRGSKSPIIQEAKRATDEEKSLASSQPVGNHDSSGMEKALAEQQPMSDIFSWQHIRYSVQVAEGSRLLLEDVSGYVAPGKLTALMGESGAGKVSCDEPFNLFVWADKIDLDHASQCASTTR